MINGPKDCIPTLSGWQREDGRIMVKWPFTQEEINEWNAAQAEPEPELLVEADPILAADPFVSYVPYDVSPVTDEEFVEIREETLASLTKVQLEDLGREHGIELDRRKSKSALINTMKDLLKRT